MHTLLEEKELKLRTNVLGVAGPVGLWRNRRFVGAWQTHVRIAPYIAPRQRETHPFVILDLAAAAEEEAYFRRPLVNQKAIVISRSPALIWPCPSSSLEGWRQVWSLFACACSMRPV